eukprot:TRINITY_DN63644_c0_g1_i1.p3 TRINITY_DN63644_c0_g1~~TRINITY_DN63644_c0_g1_i1.p3  ORF type:complete len:112 (+),score=27.79 TRINITY_DN63644_c0_g1_i1:100-435(+)
MCIRDRLDSRPAAGLGTTKGNAASLRTSTFGPMASPAMPAKTARAILFGDKLYRFSWPDVLSDMHLWRWAGMFLQTCYSPGTLQRTTVFLRDNSPYFCDCLLYTSPSPRDS